MQIYKLLLLVFSIAVLLTVMLPFIKKDHWIFRVFDYPRVQKFVLTGVALALWLTFFNDTRKWYELVIILVLAISFLRLGALILPFTPLGKKMIMRAPRNHKRKVFTGLVSNVYQFNADYSQLLQLVKERNPDTVFLLETDQKWYSAVQPLKKEYPYHIEVPLSNTYGMLFYSRLPIVHQEINYLIDPEIPSIVVDVEFDQSRIRIYGVHPTPPVPQEATYSTDRDAELLIVGKMAKKYGKACVVMGDLNDVAWSYSTRLFLKASGLLDPRLGRGMYNTFHAKYALLRWPLDHFFVSHHFHLESIKVERSIGSDHFPISIGLTFCDVDDSEKLKPDHSDKELINEKIDAGLNNDPL